MKLNESEELFQASLRLQSIVKTEVLCGLQDEFDGNLFTGQMAIGVEATGA